MDSIAHKRQRPDSDDDIDASTLFRAQENFPKFIIIESTNKETQVTSLSPFVIEKQIESMIGTPKSVKKLKNGTLLVETTRKMQTDILLKSKKFFNLPVEVKPHKTLNSSKGIIRDRNLKGESEKNILEYLENQGVTAVKRFTVKKGQDTINTNTLLLTFDSVVPPKSLKIFYQIIPVDLYIPNPLRCFNCQKFGHHEDKCPVDPGSVCERCGMGNHDHHTNHCKNPTKCVNCGGAHLSRSNECETWKKEKEIMRLKITKNLTYLEARKQLEQKPEFSFSHIVKSLAAKPETKTAATQYSVEDCKITESSKVLIARKPNRNNNSQNQNLTSSKSLSEQAKVSSKPNQPSTNAKPHSASSRVQKGSDDPVQQFNKFGALANDDAMEMDEVASRPGSRGHRPRSPITAPK